MAPDASSHAVLLPFVVQGNAGDLIFSAGDTGRDLFVLLEGRVELVGPPPASPVVSGCGAGDVFGERALFSDAPRDVTARAASPFRALRLDRETLTKIGAEDAGVLWWLLDRVAAVRLVQASSAAAAPAAPAPRPIRKASLVVAPGGRVMPLSDQPESWVGRRDTASAFTPEVDLTDIDVDRSLSRKHARLLRREGRLFVVEASGARNGTFVNGQRLGDGEAELSDGDRVRFGLVDTVFRVTDT